MTTRSPRRRPGFTLMELLIACGLIGVVMAMAMQAFMGLNKISNQTRSKLIASSEASKGVLEVAALIRRAHIIFYTGKPITAGTTVDAVGETAAGDGMDPVAWLGTNDPRTDAVPAQLGGGAGGLVTGPKLPYAFQQQTLPTIGNTAIENLKRGQFRFWDYNGGGIAADATSMLVGPAHRLKTADPYVALPYDRFFPSPLLYIAEANLATDGNNDGTVGDMFMPVSWTFHVVYLAPMDVSLDFTEGHPRPWESTNRQMDLAPPAANAPAGAKPWARSTVPFELRVLTVPGVDADKNGTIVSTHTPVLTPNNVVEYLDAPFDYPPNGVNYDPIAIPFIVGVPGAPPTLGAASALGAAQTFRPGPGGPPPPMTLYKSAGARVNGALHVNYNNVGNDPPNAAALAIRIPGNTPRDRVIAQYVDPDSVHGTCVRLLNNIGATPGQTASQETQHAVSRGQFRRYLNAYGGEYLYNHYKALLPAGSVWSTQMGAPLPKRALISVATRYRNDSRVPFQFASDQIEVDLENLVRYQSINRRGR